MERGNYAASASSSPFNDGVSPSSSASQQPSSFAPSPFCCSRVGRLKFKDDSILFQRQMCYLSLCVVSFRCRRERNAAAAAASDVQVKRRQLLARSPTANSSEISTSDQVRPPFLQRVALTMPGIHRARATLNVECGQDCENAGLSIHHRGKCGQKLTDRR